MVSAPPARRDLPGQPAADVTNHLRTAVERGLAASERRPLILGVAGAQGSGKSTVAPKLARMLNLEGRRAAHLSLDDFYLGRAERRGLASRVHPLFVTRGPPGTHDVEGALAFLAAVRKGEEAKAPRFDKIRDEPSPQGQIVPAELQVLVFEGWCLGARPQDEQALSAPVNMLERVFDRDGVWRRAANEALGGAYQTLYAEIGRLVFLRAPDFDIVRRWRAEQEATLAADLPPETRVGVMAPDEISFFIQHFERITRFMMDDLPSRADLTLHLDERRRVAGVVSR